MTHSARVPVWPVAVSERSPAVLAGPRRPAFVLAAFSSALYLRTDDGVLPVVTPTGLRLPTSLVLATELDEHGWGVLPGSTVLVGAGEVLLPRAVLRVVRSWRPVAVTTGQRPVSDRSWLAGVAASTWRCAAGRLTRRLLTGRAVEQDVRSLVGAGPGLTPSGDDVLSGALLGLRLHSAAARELVPTLWAAVRGRLGATTDLSAALLTEASQGYAVPPVVRLGAALAGGRTGDLSPLVARVRSIGHTSGSDLLAGLAGALEALQDNESHLAARTATGSRARRVA